jgi:hypothetical protein
VRGWLLVVSLAGCRGFFDTPPVTPDAPPSPDAPAAPVAYVQSAANSITASNSVTVGFPLAQRAGNANFLVIGWADGSLVSVHDGNGNVYMAATGPMQAGDGWNQQIYLATNIVEGANTVNVSFDAQLYAHVGILEYSGIAGIDQSTGAIGTASSSPQTSSINTSGHDLLLAVLSAQNPINTTIVPSFTSRLSGSEYLVADAETQNPGMFDAVTTAHTQADWVMQLLALRAE